MIETPHVVKTTAQLIATIHIRGGKTELKIVQTSHDFEADYVKKANVGWGEAFEKLEAHLASEQSSVGRRITANDE